MLKKLCLLVSINLLIVITIYAQSQNEIDSLLFVASSSKTDTNLVKTYEKIARLYLRIDLDSSKVYAQKMIDLSHELDYQKGYAMGNNWLGESYFLQGKYDSCLIYYKITNKTFEKIGKNRLWSYSLIAISNVYTMLSKYDSSIILLNQVIQFNIGENDIKSASKAMLNLAQLYSNQGEYALAKRKLYDAKLNFEILGDDYWTMMADKSIAILYSRQGEPDSAMVIYANLIDFYKSKDDSYNLGEAYSNMGVIYEGAEDFDKALFAYKKSLEYRNKVNDPRGKALSEMNLASVYFNLKEYDSVILYLDSSRIFLENTNAIHPLTLNFILSGNYYTQLNQFAKAEKMYLKAYEYATKYGAKDYQRDAAQYLSSIYEEQYDFENALKYYKIYKVEYDSILNEGNIREEAMAQEGYKYKLQLFNKEKEILIEKQQKTIVGVIGVIGFVFLILFLLYRQKIQKSKDFRIKQENEIKLRKTELDIQHSERKRLAMILHDNIAHLITISQSQINTLIKNDKLKSERTYLEQIEENLLLTHKMAKIASYELEFSLVLEQNLIDQFINYINRIKHSHSPKIDFQYSKKSQFDNLSDEVKVNLFSVFQEMLGNALKYSNAMTITISLISDEGKTTLHVIDNGIGFNYGDVRHGQGFPNMKERADKLNGKFSYESEVGFGTKLMFIV